MAAVRRTVVLSFAALLAATPLVAQVRELPVAFDAAGRIMVVTQSMADSLRLASPFWPVAGAFTEARLHRQEGAGYVVVVTRPDGALERFSISLEQFEAIRGRFAARASETAAAPPTQVPAAQPVSSVPPTTAQARNAGRSFANGQVLLASVVWGPAIGNSARAMIDDPLASYAAWFGTIGATLYLARREMDRGPTLAQSILANHAGLHGAGIGAAMVRALGAEAPSDSGRNANYTSAMFAGGVAGALLGYSAGRRLSEAGAAASGFAADVGLLVSTAAIASQDKLGDNFDSGAAATLVGGTLAGYLVGPLYPARAPSVTSGDVVALGAPGIVGVLAAATVIEASGSDQEESANVLSAGLLGGIAAGHFLLARRVDHTIEQAGLLFAATAVGAYIGAQVGSLDDRIDETRTLTVATLGAGAAIWLMERRFAMDRPTSSRLRGVHGWSRLKLDLPALGMAAARVPGVHPILSISR